MLGIPLVFEELLGLNSLIGRITTERQKEKPNKGCYNGNVDQGTVFHDLGDPYIASQIIVNIRSDIDGNDGAEESG